VGRGVTTTFELGPTSIAVHTIDLAAPWPVLEAQMVAMYQWRRATQPGSDHRLVAFAGLSGSGKDAAAGHLVEGGYVRVAIADALKRAMSSWRREIERRLASGDRVVCSDIRTKAELDIIAAIGGTRLRLRRPGARAPGAAGAHHTETEMDEVGDEHFDQGIDNDADLACLAGALPPHRARSRPSITRASPSSIRTKLVRSAPVHRDDPFTCSRVNVSSSHRSRIPTPSSIPVHTIAVTGSRTTYGSTPSTNRGTASSYAPPSIPSAPHHRDTPVT